jgi:hypothetical protein
LLRLPDVGDGDTGLGGLSTGLVVTAGGETADRVTDRYGLGGSGTFGEVAWGDRGEAAEGGGGGNALVPGAGGVVALPAVERGGGGGGSLRPFCSMGFRYRHFKPESEAR